MYLIGKDLWDIVNGTEEVAHDADDADKRKLKKREKMALATVCLFVSQSIKYAWGLLRPQKKQNSFNETRYREKFFIEESCILLVWKNGQIWCNT